MKTKKSNTASLVIELIEDTDIGGFTACVPGIAAYGEGETQEEAITDLKEALLGYTEAFGLDEAKASQQKIVLQTMSVDLAKFIHG